MTDALDLDDVLDEYGLERGKLADYVDCMVRMTQKETWEEMGVSRWTVQNYKKKMDAMTPRERVFVISSVMAGRRAELEAVSERSEGGEQ